MAIHAKPLISIRDFFISESEKKILQVIDMLPVYITALKVKICYFKASTVC